MRDDDERMVRRKALIATMRNEGPFILEWVVYHRLIGFTEMVVCTNDCVDASPELLDLLQDRGLVRHLRCTPAPDEGAQLFAYAQAQKLLEPCWPDVLMVLDADEYLNVHVGGGTLDDLLGAVPEATAFLLNWRIFGSSGHRRWSAQPVTRRFTRAAARDHGVNWSFKTLFTRPQAYWCPLLAHGPGHARPECVDGLHAVDGAGLPVAERYVRAEGFLQTEPGHVSWALAQVNHYNTRSWEDYLAKHDRGGGLGPERWHRDANWRVFDRNEEEDMTIQRHMPALTQAMATLLADPAICAAHERCRALYGRLIARLDGRPA